MQTSKNEPRHLRKTRNLKGALKSLIAGDLDRLEQFEREIADLKTRVAELESAQASTRNVTLAGCGSVVDEDEAA